MMKDKLEFVVARLLRWQADEDAAHRKRGGRCLEALRHALGEAGLHLPISNVDYPGMSAVTCGKTLLKDPGKWNWKQVGSSVGIPLPRYTLVFFKATLLNRHGHVGILDLEKKLLYSNLKTCAYAKGWQKRLFVAFTPL